MNDPFQVLGISPSASEEEIKQAYRRLAKKYHPDLNPGDAAAEAKMKEINEAYTMAIKMKKGGYTGQQTGGYGAYQQRQNPYGGRGGYSQQQNPYGSQGGQQWGPFGFGGFQGYQRSNANYQHARRTYDNPELQAASDYIQTGRYQEALNMLNRIPSHDAPWHALHALANMGLGNRIAALNSARQAVQMEPDNMEYRNLLEQLEYGSRAYQQAGGFNDIRNLICSNPCLTCCLVNSLINCCCGFRRC